MTRGVILCAGSSTRIGRPKALLPLAGSTFLHRIITAMIEGGVDDVVVVVGGAHAEEIHAAVEKERVPAGTALRVVENRDPSPGPISSIQRGIAAPPRAGDAPPSAVLIHPVDIPGVTSTDVRAILDAAARCPSAEAVIPSIDRHRAHPVLLRATLAGRALALAPGKTLRDLLHDPHLEVHYVEHASPLLLRDINTLEEYARLEKELGSR